MFCRKPKLLSMTDIDGNHVDINPDAVSYAIIRPMHVDLHFFNGFDTLKIPYAKWIKARKHFTYVEVL